MSFRISLLCGYLVGRNPRLGRGLQIFCRSAAVVDAFEDSKLDQSFLQVVKDGIDSDKL